MRDSSPIHPRTSRRSLLKLGAALGAATLVSGRGAQAQAVKVRHDIKSATGGQMLDHYSAAVKKMQEPALNTPPQPHSWTFQAYVHGVPADPAHPVQSAGIFHGTPQMTARIDALYGNPAPGSPQAAWKAAATDCWGTCPHFSPWFVAWHRWYLLYFEEIVRAMSGHADFTLPYWNYASNQGASLRLPAPFQLPTDPLYEQLRGLGFANPAGSGPQNVPMNQNGYMPYSQTNYDPALQGTNLFPSDATYAVPPQSQYYAFGFAGRVECQPHDNVHDNVGGLMSNIAVAAGDPIFFVHHCQIDRLWAAWQAAPGSVYNWGTGATDPSQATWENRKFMFVDEAGKVVTVTTDKQLSTKKLGYEYDELPKRPSAIAAVARANVAGLVQLAAARASGLTVGSGGTRTRLAPAPAAPPTAAAPQATPGEQTLVLSDVKLIARPPAPLHVFLNLPEGGEATLESPYYVGTLNFFNWDTGTGGRMMDTEGGHSMTGTGEFRFSVGDILARQKAENLWDGGDVSVTVTTLGADRSTGRTYVTIGQVELLP
jgi:tyrosinase